MVPKNRIGCCFKISVMIRNHSVGSLAWDDCECAERRPVCKEARDSKDSLDQQALSSKIERLQSLDFVMEPVVEAMLS